MKKQNTIEKIRSLKGREAVEKGKLFEEDVADLYSLLGAKVVRNIEICNKKIDVFATFFIPGSSIGHRILVECKDEKEIRAQNQRVMELKGILDTARMTFEADSAAIITRVPWGDEAKGFARKSGIELLTYDEKTAQLLDFKWYFKKLIDRYEKVDPQRRSEPALADYFVDISAEYINQKEEKEVKEITEHISKWMKESDDKRHLAILGEYGTGKTAFCKKFAHDLAKLYVNESNSTRIPILFNLRDFTKNVSIESLVTSLLDQECGVSNPKFRLFEAMNNAGLFLLIFDGFDEMAVRVDSDTLESNLREIEKLIGEKSKVIITSRIEYFISAEEQEKALHPKGEIFSTRDIEYTPLKILPWNDKQINSFLERRVPLIREAIKPWTYYRDKIHSLSGLKDLSRRPVLLEMIVRTLPRLIEEGKPINRPNLYETYLREEIRRQKIIKERRLLLSENTRFILLQDLALEFYGGDIAGINYKQSMKIVEKTVKPTRDELEAYTRDFLTCSFLIREKDQFIFSHRSIMEYLVSKALIEEINKDKPIAFGKHRLDYLVTSFIAELNPNVNILWEWIVSTKNGIVGNTRYLGGNAASVLCAMDKEAFKNKDLSNTMLCGANLHGADMRGTILDNTLLENTYLADAKFNKRDIQGAKMHNVKISINMVGTIKNIKERRKNIEKSKFGFYHGDERNYVHPLMSKLRETCNVDVDAWLIEGDPEPQEQKRTFFCSGLINLKENKCFDLIQECISKEDWIIKSAIYANDNEKLVREMPKFGNRNRWLWEIEARD